MPRTFYVPTSSICTRLLIFLGILHLLILITQISLTLCSAQKPLDILPVLIVCHDRKYTGYSIHLNQKILGHTENTHLSQHNNFDKKPGIYKQ